MLGIVENKDNITTLAFEHADSSIYLLGKSLNDINCSEYLVSYHKFNESTTPFFDLDIEFDLQTSVSSLIKNKLILSAHDVSDGGLFITLLESSMHNNLGFSIQTNDQVRKDAFLFGESPSRVIVSVSKEKERDFENHLSSTKTIFSKIGHVTSGEILVNDKSFGNTKDYKKIYDSSISKKMQ